jgi:hypothetical protein
MNRPRQHHRNARARLHAAPAKIAGEPIRASLKLAVRYCLVAEDNCHGPRLRFRLCLKDLMKQELTKGTIGVRGNTIFEDLLRVHPHHSTRRALKWRVLPVIMCKATETKRRCEATGRIFSRFDKIPLK